MKKKIKILHLLSQRPDSTGSGIYVQAMMRESAACGHENYLVAAYDFGQDLDSDQDLIKPENSLFVEFNTADLPYHIPGMSDVMPYLSTRFSSLSKEDLVRYETAFTRTLKKAVQEFKPDVIHSHHLWIVSSLVRRIFPDIPIVTSCHGSDLRQFQNSPHLQEKVLAGCQGLDSVLALCESQKEEIIRLYGLAPERIKVTGAGYNSTLFYPVPKPEPDPVQLVYVGKLSKAKGVPWFLRAIKSLNFPDLHLHIVGSGTGEEKEVCLALARELGARVSMHGAVPQDKLAEIVRQSHVLVLPSFYEGLPLVVLEGLACGCRIIATDLPGTKEILADVNVDFVSLVRTPRLRLLDQPFPEDIDLFEQDLTHALEFQVKAASKAPNLNLACVREKIDSFSWTGIFRKIRSAYFECLG